MGFDPTGVLRKDGPELMEMSKQLAAKDQSSQDGKVNGAGKEGFIDKAGGAAFAFGFWLAGYLYQDSCLDAGGAWSNKRNICVGLEPASQD